MSLFLQLFCISRRYNTQNQSFQIYGIEIFAHQFKSKRSKYYTKSLYLHFNSRYLTGTAVDGFILERKAVITIRAPLHEDQKEQKTFQEELGWLNNKAKSTGWTETIRDRANIITGGAYKAGYTICQVVWQANRQQNWCIWERKILSDL